MDEHKATPPATGGGESPAINTQEENKQPQSICESAGAIHQAQDAEANKSKGSRKNEPLKKKLFWWAVYALIAVMMATGVYMIVIQYVYVGDSKPFEAPPTYAPASSAPAPSAPASTPAPSETPAAATPEPTPVIPLAPVQITLVKPEIQCDIEPVGAQNGEMGTIDSAAIIAWYQDGMAPNEGGNCILNGHVSWKGKKGAFAYLNEIEEGEEVVLKLEDGSYLYYEVYSVEEHPYDDFPAHHMVASGMHRLTLITCKGDFDRAAGTSLTRTVVVCLPLAEVNG